MAITSPPDHPPQATLRPRPRLERPNACFPLCYHGDGFVPWEEATLHVGSLALRYALSVFEGVRLYAQHDGSGVLPFRLAEHLARFRQSLRLMRLPEPEGNLNELLSELIRRNEVREDSYVRISASPYNSGTIGAPAQLCLTITIVRMGRKRWLAEGRPMRVAISGWQRSPDSAFPAAAKNISSYAGPRLALLEARDAGYDDVVLTSHDGFLCEAPTSALFLVKSGRLLTPSLSEGVLPSITRAAVFDLCTALGIPCLEQRLTRTDAYTADEAFLCGTGLEFGPIESFNGHHIGPAASPGLTSCIVDAYFQLARNGGEAGSRPSTACNNRGDLP
jgi:branched-chain amino acid aminotransferase